MNDYEWILMMIDSHGYIMYILSLRVQYLTLDYYWITYCLRFCDFLTKVSFVSNLVGLRREFVVFILLFVKHNFSKVCFYCTEATALHKLLWLFIAENSNMTGIQQRVTLFSAPSRFSFARVPYYYFRCFIIEECSNAIRSDSFAMFCLLYVCPMLIPILPMES